MLLLTLLYCAVGGYIFSVIFGYVWGIYENYGKPFDWRSTADKVAKKIGTNLKDKIILITGCNSGIGKETAKVLLKYGAHIIMACRNRSKAEKARNDILHSLCNNMHLSSVQKSDLEKRIEIRILDVSSLESVYTFSRNFLASNMELHIIVNNAGIMALPQYTESMNQYELQFATNHLGHFYLTKLLLNKLIETNKRSSFMGKVIDISSMAHLYTLPLHSTIDECLRNVSAPSRSIYNKWKNYGFSKAANILHSNEINRRYGNVESNVYSVSLHPGVIGSNLQNNMSWYEQLGWGFLLALPGLTKSIEQGAATTVYTVCLSDDEFKEHGGIFFRDCGVVGGLIEASKACNGNDVSLQKKLWTLSEKLITKKGFELTVN